MLKKIIRRDRTPSAESREELSLSDIQERAARRRRRLRALFALFIFGLAAVGAAWLLVRSPLFRFRSLAIEGNRLVPQEDILHLLQSRIFDDSYFQHLLGFRNMLIWPRELSAEDLKLAPVLKKVSVEKDYFSRSLVVRAEERNIFGVWCYEKLWRCVWFDEEGTIVERAPFVEGNLIVRVSDFSQESYSLREKVLPAQFLPPLFSVLKVLAGSGLAVKEIRLDDLALQELAVRTKKGPNLYFSLRFSSENALPVIRSLVENGKPTPFEDLEYVDFRVEHRAYYR